MPKADRDTYSGVARGSARKPLLGRAGPCSDAGSAEIEHTLRRWGECPGQQAEQEQRQGTCSGALHTN